MRGGVVVRSTLEEKEDNKEEDEFWRHAPGEKGRQPLTRFCLFVFVCLSLERERERERKRGFLRFCLSFFDGRDPMMDDDSMGD